MKFTEDYANYQRRESRNFDIHVYAIGGNNYIRLQSMTNTDTCDIEATAKQVMEIAEQGADYVRVTTPTKKDVEALYEIKRIIKSFGLETPLIADIHFNPKVAMAAIEVADKIRINPGNLVNSKRFENEQDELNKIKEVFIPILQKAKKYNIAIRVGTNMGSLSDRILNKYGATPEGLVAATMEYLDICNQEDFEKTVVSIKASNALVNIQANRLLVAKMKEKGYDYPIHLGVTEAGNGIEGRVKSAVGIGALLIDGIGDTVRVSLTEDPQNEIPVARKIVNYATSRAKQEKLPELKDDFFSPYEFKPRKTYKNLISDRTIVIADFRNKEKIAENFEQQPDFAIVNNDTEQYAQQRGITPVWEDKTKEFALLNAESFEGFNGKFAFVETKLKDLENKKLVKDIERKKNAALIFIPETDNFIGELRIFIHTLQKLKCYAPIIIKLDYQDKNFEDLAIKASIDSGVFFIDGLANGLWINSPNTEKANTEIAFEILQASGRRISKAEFISCPGCGRTTFDLEPVTEKIKKRLSGRKGLKIAIMGCIVNGLGEMADADYGYVGTGKGKVSLYHKKELIKKDIPEEKALDELEKLIVSTQQKNERL